MLLVVPGQDAWELGAELLLLASGLGGALGWLNRRAMAQRSAQPISRILGAVSPDAITTILLAAAGGLLLAGVDGRVYVLVPALIGAVLGGGWSARVVPVPVTPGPGGGPGALGGR